MAITPEQQKHIDDGLDKLVIGTPSTSATDELSMCLPFRYTVKVLPNNGDAQATFEIASPSPIDERLLQLCGLILDGGCPPEVIRSEVPKAQSYAVVNCDHREQWVDDSLSGMI